MKAFVIAVVTEKAELKDLVQCNSQKGLLPKLSKKIDIPHLIMAMLHRTEQLPLQGQRL